MKKLPKIPKSVMLPLGRATVAVVKDLRDENGKPCYGIWRTSERDIRLDKSMSLSLAWSTLWHEWAHGVMRDLRIPLSDSDEERVCDAVGLARVMEMYTP